MGAVSCYIEHVITEFAFMSAFAFVSCCIRFFHLPVTSCKFAMQAEEVCVYTSVKFDLCSAFASVRASGR